MHHGLWESVYACECACMLATKIKLSLWLHLLYHDSLYSMFVLDADQQWRCKNVFFTVIFVALSAEFLFVILFVFSVNIVTHLNMHLFVDVLTWNKICFFCFICCFLFCFLPQHICFVSHHSLTAEIKVRSTLYPPLLSLFLPLSPALPSSHRSHTSALLISFLSVLISVSRFSFTTSFSSFSCAVMQFSLPFN